MTPDKTEPQEQKSRWWVWLLVLIAAGVGAYLFLPRIAQTNAAAAKDKKGGKGGDRPVPVVAAMSRKGDMPVYLNGLGIGHGVQHRDRAVPRRRADHEGRVHRRPAGEEGRSSRSRSIRVRFR